MVAVEAQILTKVIERAGGKEKLRKRFKAIDKWLRGEKHPTIRQLEELSRLSGIPFGYIIIGHLSEPFDELKMPFFRKGEGAPPSVELVKLVRKNQLRVDFCSEYLRELGHEPVDFVGSLSTDTCPEDAAKLIREILELDIEWVKSFTTRKEALGFLRKKLEYKGVFVFMNSQLEDNTKAKLDPREFKGFAIADRYAPTIFVNTNTYISTQIFTLVHEFVHVLLGESAISQLSEEEFVNPEAEVERFCNRVAAAFLVPEEELAGSVLDYKTLCQLSQDLKISLLVILIRAYEKGLLKEQKFNELYSIYQTEFLKWLENEEKAEQGQGFPSWYTLKMNRLGKRFLKLAITALETRSIPPNHFYSLTGIKLSKVQKFKEFLN